MLILLVVGALTGVGCSGADVDLSIGPSAARGTATPAALTRPTVAPSTFTPPHLVMRPTRDPLSTGNPAENSAADLEDDVVPDSGPGSTGTALSVNLTILAPTQGAALDVGAVRVLGVTRGNAQVTVNGIPTEVIADGSFTRDLILGPGINTIEAIARDPSGLEVSERLVLLFVPRTEGVPLSILFPQGLEVSDPNLTIMGATRPDAVVGVNGVPVEINNVGIFSTTVVLEEGTNLIEIVAVDLDENVNYQTVVVFYLP